MCPYRYWSVREFCIRRRDCRWRTQHLRLRRRPRIWGRRVHRESLLQHRGDFERVHLIMMIWRKQCEIFNNMHKIWTRTISYIIALTSTQFHTGITQFSPIRKWQTLPKRQYTLILHHTRDSPADGATRGLHARLDKLDGMGEIDGEGRRETAAGHGFEEVGFAWLGERHGDAWSNFVVLDTGYAG